jgi:hypothetical protein
LLALVFAAPVAQRADAASLVSQWVQLNAGGAAQARVAVNGSDCPAIVIDGRASPMHLRAPEDNAFSVRVCSAPIPAGVKAASVEGQNLPLPVAAPQRIVVFGDTGCRIKGLSVQDCNDPAKWPFPQITAEAARTNPDLVLHVGDYLYRESPCPPTAKGCAGSPSGDTWPSWNADFFAPAAPLLAAAPWVFVRGNHETCPRSGAGWLRLLGPPDFDVNAKCVDHIKPYAVPLGAMNLVVMDDTQAPDETVDHDLLAQYREDFASLATIAPKPLWLAMHRPIWGAITLDIFGMKANGGGNRTLIASLDPAQLAPVALLLSGHIHTFEALNYGDGLPPQIVAGYGGDRLDSAPPDLTGLNLSGRHVKDGISLPGFGFLLLTKAGDGWTVEVHDVTGAIERTCRFAGGALDCGVR